MKTRIPNINTFATLIDRLAIENHKTGYFENLKRQEHAKLNPDVHLISQWDNLSRESCELRAAIKNQIDELFAEIVSSQNYLYLNEPRTFRKNIEAISTIVDQRFTLIAKSAVTDELIPALDKILAQPAEYFYCNAGTHVKIPGKKCQGCVSDRLRIKYDENPIYRLKIIFRSMYARCYHQKNKSYKNYGARGITICEDWLFSVDNFIYWAMSNGYEKGKEIDRKNNEGSYSPENCQWVSHRINSINKRINNLRALPVGVCTNRTGSKFRTRISLAKTPVLIGSYKDVILAGNIYQTFFTIAEKFLDKHNVIIEFIKTNGPDKIGDLAATNSLQDALEKVLSGE